MTELELPQAFQPLFNPARYHTCFGGRGGARSWSVAQVLLVKSLQTPSRILCVREFQNSIAQSVHKLLSDQIARLELDCLFTVTKTAITSTNGSEFIFAGIRNNPTKIKSMEGITDCWVEEAETVSATSWDTLIPTIRTPGSEFYLTFNPCNESDPTYQRFVVSPPADSIIIKTTFDDNPFFPEVLEQERLWCQKTDLDLYNHIWGGECRSFSKAQIFYDKCVVNTFTPLNTWSGPHYGLDFGFANDPNVMTRCWIFEGKLYVEKEAVGQQTEIDKLPDLLLKADPHCNKYTMRADCSRPETISYMVNHNFPKVIACKKWTGSVEDGITFIRSFEQIVIHPSCVNIQMEAKMYKYKTDRLTGDVLPDVVDAYNHSWDSLRYALQPLIQHYKSGEIRIQ